MNPHEQHTTAGPSGIVQVRTEMEVDLAKTEIMLQLWVANEAPMFAGVEDGTLRVCENSQPGDEWSVPPWYYEAAKSLAARLREYLEDPLPAPQTVFEVGMLIGKLEALLWLSGRPWEFLSENFSKLRYMVLPSSFELEPRACSMFLENFPKRRYERRDDAEVADVLYGVEDKVWYMRHVALIEDIRRGRAKVIEGPDTPPEALTKAQVLEQLEEASREVQARLGEDGMFIGDELYQGQIHGHLSALRWATGEDWDSLDV